MKRILSALTVLSISWLLCSDFVPSAPAQNGWADLKGQITLKEGQDIPKQEKLEVTKDKDHCLSKGALFSREWQVNEKNRGIQNVFVWLEPAFPGQEMPIHPSLQEIKKKEVVLDQPCCMFDPYCLGIRVGQVLVIKNDSPVIHNFRLVGVMNNININMPPKSEFKIPNLKTDIIPGNEMKCDVHPWMKGYLRAFDHPYFAISDADGKFNIANAPAGKYRLKIWHPASGWLGGEAGAKGIPLVIPNSGTVQVKNRGKPLEIEKK